MLFNRIILLNVDEMFRMSIVIDEKLFVDPMLFDEMILLNSVEMSRR